MAANVWLILNAFTLLVESQVKLVGGRSDQTKDSEAKIMWLSGFTTEILQQKINVFSADFESWEDLSGGYRSFEIRRTSLSSYFMTRFDVDFTNKRIMFTGGWYPTGFSLIGTIDFNLSEPVTLSHAYQLNRDNTLSVFSSISEYELSLSAKYTIPSVVYDWTSGNLYWATYDSIMVTDTEMRFYATLFDTFPGTATFLTLHGGKGLLFLATIEMRPQYFYNIISCDLAGKNSRVLFSYPDVTNVKGITVSYDAEKLIWTTTYGDNSRIMSSNFDGTDLTLVYEKKNSTFQTIAVYKNYIYVSDYTKRNNRDGFPYTIWIITLSERNLVASVASYNTSDIAYKLVVFQNHTEAIDRTKQCSLPPSCDRICLLRVNASRQCVCWNNEIKENCTEPMNNVTASPSNTTLQNDNDGNDGNGSTDRPIHGMSIVGVVCVVVIVIFVTFILTTLWWNRRRRRVNRASYDSIQ